MIMNVKRDRLDAPGRVRSAARSAVQSAVQPEARSEAAAAHSTLADLAVFGGGIGMSSGLTVVTSQLGTTCTAPQTYQNFITRPSAALHERSP